MSTARADEGRRVLRNVASFGAFVISPLQMLMLSRALGPTGYGQWWWTFGVLEAASILASFGADLYVRRELPRLAREGHEDEMLAVVGTGLAVVGGIGILLTLLQLGLAHPLASAQHDPDLLPFLLLLACQPLLWTLTNLLASALQSIHVLGPIAVIRGIVVPLIQVGALYLAWIMQLPTIATLIVLVAVSMLSLAIIAVIYARHLPLGRTLIHAFRPRHLRAALRYGSALLLPSVLFTAGGKLDLYVLGAYNPAAIVGVYAGCLTLAAVLPATRSLFDPIVQAQIGALHGTEDHELRASLARMTRLCMLALSPVLVGLVAVGEPVLEFLLGQPVSFAVTPLVILCVGQLIGSLAIAGWLIPMKMPGRVLAVIAGATLVVKLVLLVTLVPRYGLIGAAIATAMGTIVAQQGQVLVASQRFGLQPYATSLLQPLVASAMVAAGGRALFVALGRYTSELFATAIAGTASLIGILVLLSLVLDRSERDALRRLLRLTPRGV